MKIKIACLAAICTIFLPFRSRAQITSSNRIHFTKEISWNEILKKAKKDNKYIFIDCYASWCGPCKEMDKEVYTNDTVGNYMNSRFISVKYQLDTSKTD